jgi:hypothetical protein
MHVQCRPDTPSAHRFLPGGGGGGKLNKPPPVPDPDSPSNDAAPLPPPEAPLAPVFFSRPGILILNVCPSFKE